MSTPSLTVENSSLPLKDHPLRLALTAELHLRRFPLFEAPAQLFQLIMLSSEDDFAADRDAADRLCARFGASPPPGKHFVCGFEPFQFVWERHSEFACYTFIKVGPVDLSFSNTVLHDLPSDWVASIPGQILRATQIVVLDPQSSPPSPERIAEIFPTPDLVSCTVSSGGARIWSEFRVHEDRLGRLLIHNQSLLPGDLSRLVQHLQELGNYRNMTLLGLPDAQKLAPELSVLDRRLGVLTDQIAAARTASSAEDDRLLNELSSLSAELARLTTKTSYRMSATQAYAELTRDRLRAIGGERIEGFPTLADFMERRMGPAVRTCGSFTKRLEDLSSRTAWTSSLLRTRVETALERQSRDLLESMNQRTDLQLRLQQTVEGLSVVAISYYALSLLSYVLKAVHDFYPKADPTMTTAIFVPIVVLVVSLSLRRMRRRWHQQHS